MTAPASKVALTARMQGERVCKRSPDVGTRSTTSAPLLRCEIQPDLIGVVPDEHLGLHEVSALRRTFDQCSFLDVITAF